MKPGDDPDIALKNLTIDRLKAPRDILKSKWALGENSRPLERRIQYFLIWTDNL